jgi:hypothetical protein
MGAGDAAAEDATAGDALPGDSAGSDAAGSIIEAGGADSPGADVDAGAPSDAGAGWIFARPLCGGGDAGGGCTGADAAAFSNPKVADVDGGALAPGGAGTVSVVLSAPTMSLSYPCVGFAAENPGVSFGPGDGGPMDPTFVGIYSLLMGMSTTVSMQVHFAASIPHGTVIRFAAWADSLNSACGDGTKVEWDVTLP